MKLPIKDIFKRIKITKERLVFLSLVILLGVIASAGGIGWLRYYHDLDNQLNLIENEQLGKTHEEIKLEDLEYIEQKFGERQSQYEASNSIKVREAF